MTQQTSWRKAFDSPYLASWDIDGTATLTISHVTNERNKMSKNITHNVAHFKEPELRKGEKLKPMILNATNCKTLHELSGSLYIEGWADQRVTVYVKEDVKGADGTMGQGLRLRAPKPKPVLHAKHERFSGAVAAYQRDGNLDAVKKHFEISEEVEQLIKEQSSETDTSQNSTE